MSPKFYVILPTYSRFVSNPTEMILAAYSKVPHMLPAKYQRYRLVVLEKKVVFEWFLTIHIYGHGGHLDLPIMTFYLNFV